MYVLIVETNEGCSCHPDYETSSVLVHKRKQNMDKLTKTFENLEPYKHQGYHQQQFLDWLVKERGFVEVTNFDTWCK